MLVMSLFATTAQSQGIVYINRDVYNGQNQTIAPHSSGVTNIALVKKPRHGSFTSLGSAFNYAAPNKTCLDTFTISYTLTNGGIKTFNYASYAVRVDNAFLDLTPDFGFTNKNQSVTVNVLSNDNARTKTGAGSLILGSVTLKNNCEAVVVSDDEIKLTPLQGFVGQAYVNYVVCDDTYGNCKSGVLTVQVNDTPNKVVTADEISVAKNTAIIVLTPRSGFTASSAPTNGIITFVEKNAFRYTPANGFTGTDQVQFTNTITGQSHTVKIEVINKPTSNRYAIDDVVYTAENRAVSFDVMTNDRAINPRVANFYKPNPSTGQLRYDTLTGKFIFIPANNFRGIAKFTYNLKNGGGTPTINNIDEWATVNVVVSNHYPAKQVFELKTPINTPLVLNYNVPIAGWEFSVFDAAQNGAVTTPAGFTTLSINAQTSVSGNNLIIYKPNNNFTGIDEFSLLYNVNGIVKNVKVYVNVEAVTPSLPQYCVGDCVWSGDANNDGIVNIVDILPIGYCQGEQGFGRQNASTNWFGQSSVNWNQPLMPGTNLKYVDTNGDSEITSEDLTPIKAHYLKTHKITAERTKNYKAVPLSFQLLTPNPQIGDLVEVDVLMGANGYAATDMHGFTMEFPFDESVVNYNSFQMNFYPNSWMTYNSPTISLAQKHSGKQVDFGLVRTSGSSASGIGRVAKMSFIVDDEIHGFRDEDGTYTATIKMQGGATMGSDGVIYDLEPQEIKIPIRTQKAKTTFDGSKVITYPNPANNEVNVYINGGYEMSAYQVYNLAGQQLLQATQYGKSAQINVSDFQNGIYFVKVITDGGVVTKKFEVIKQ